MKYLVGILVIIIIILIGALSFTAGKTGLLSKFIPATTPESSGTTATPTLTATPTVSTKTVTGGGVLSFPKYQLTVPTDWVKTRQSQSASDEKIILSKGTWQISILQGGFGGAMCLYPGDADSEGPSSRYDAFKEITTLSGDLLRRSWIGDELTATGYGICNKTQYGWEAPTKFGAISIVTPTTRTRAMLDEIDTVLASLTRL
jgi:hypothetical protein